MVLAKKRQGAGRALALAAALSGLAGLASSRCFASPRPAGAPRPGLSLRASSGSEVWKEAYGLELDRNSLLREQLQSLEIQSGLEPAAPPKMPEECEVDWEQSYEQLAACNKALEEALSGGGGLQAGGRSVAAEAKADAKEPLMFEVSLPAQGGAKERVELVRFFGWRSDHQSSFYALRARLPLGLRMTKRESGELQGAFLVEEALPGGAAAESGLVLEGDVLHAFTAVMDGSDLGMKTEDFVSSVVGGLGRYRQAMVDATYINTLEDLIDQLTSNTMLSSDTELVLIFERDVSVSPMPAQPLEPLAKQ